MEQSYAGMTVNERLFVSGRLKEFEDAVKMRNNEKVIEILKSLQLDNQTIQGILSKYKME